MGRCTSFESTADYNFLLRLFAIYHVVSQNLFKGFCVLFTAHFNVNHFKGMLIKLAFGQRFSLQTGNFSPFFSKNSEFFKLKSKYFHKFEEFLLTFWESKYIYENFLSKRVHAKV